MKRIAILIVIITIISSLVLVGCDSLKQINCPQINVSISVPSVKGMLPSIDVKEYDGWKLAPYDLGSLLGFGFGKISCYRGHKEGQNPHFLYCGDKSGITSMAFIQKTLMNEDGTIGETLKKSFINIYEEKIDEDLKYICDKSGSQFIYRTVTSPSGNQDITLECGKDEYFYVFKETICGEDPDKIAEREAKQLINEMKSFG